jgi:hypothetical protein
LGSIKDFTEIKPWDAVPNPVLAGRQMGQIYLPPKIKGYVRYGCKGSMMPSARAEPALDILEMHITG